jgi:hypothetical protein
MVVLLLLAALGAQVGLGARPAGLAHQAAEAAALERLAGQAPSW